MDINQGLDLIINFIMNNFWVLLPTFVFGFILYMYVKSGMKKKPEGYRDWLQDFKKHRVKEMAMNITHYRWLCRGGKRVGFIRRLSQVRVFPIKNNPSNPKNKKVIYSDKGINYYKMTINTILLKIGKLHIPNPFTSKFCLFPLNTMREFDNRLVLPFDSDFIEYKRLTMITCKEAETFENIIDHYYIPRWKQEMIENTSAGSIIKLSSIVPEWGHSIEHEREKAKIEAEKRKAKGIEL